MLYVCKYFSLLQSSLLIIIFLPVIPLVSTFLQFLLFFCSRLTMSMPYGILSLSSTSSTKHLSECSNTMFLRSSLGFVRTDSSWRFLFHCNLSFYLKLHNILKENSIALNKGCSAWMIDSQ